MTCCGKCPTVSIVIPVFNTAIYLKQCLNSVLAQILPDIEIICVDNGSSDGSLAILKQFESEHNNIVVLEHPEGRQAGARNAGMAIARGEYIGFVDSDDYVSPLMFQRLYTAAKDNNADISVCNISTVEKDGKILKAMLPGHFLSPDYALHIGQNVGLLRNTTICNKLYASNFIQEYGLRFPEGLYYEDVYFVIVAYLHAGLIATVPEQLYFYRKNRENSTTTDRGSNVFDIFEILQQTETSAEETPYIHDLRPILHEVMAAKFMHLMHATPKGYRRSFFTLMKQELKQLTPPESPKVITPTEIREFKIIRVANYPLYDIYVRARQFYGNGRSNFTRNR